MLLTLDETTLFYHYHRTPAASADKKLSGVIKNWVKTIEPGPVTGATKSSKTGSSASSVRSTSTGQQKSITMAATPIISDKIDITTAEDEEAEGLERGAVADEFELDGPEGEFAVLSPTKGGKRVTHDVSSLPYLHLYSLIILMAAATCQN